MPLLVIDNQKSKDWPSLSNRPEVIFLDDWQNRLGCRKDDPFLQDLVARKIIGARPDLILLVGWNQPLNKSFWKNLRIPRISRPNGVRPHVFYLSDTAMAEFPDAQDSLTQYRRARQRENPILDYHFEVKVYWLLEDEPVGDHNVSLSCTTSFPRKIRPKELRGELLYLYIEAVRRLLTQTQDLYQ